MGLSLVKLGFFSKDLVQDALEKVLFIQELLRIALSSKTNYTDQMICDVVFMEDKKVLLKVSLMKRVIRFWKKANLSPRFLVKTRILLITSTKLYN